MDIRRVKIILILLFVVINIALVFILAFTGSGNTVSAKTINHVYELFEKNGINIKCDIPRNTKPLPALVMGGETAGGRKEGETFTSAEMGFETDNYELFHDFDKFMLYVEVYKGRHVLENRLLVGEGSVQYVRRENSGFNHSAKNITPAYSILLREYLNSDVSEIRSIKLAYLRYPEEDIVGPVWFISSDTGTRLFYAYEAFSGIEIKGSFIN